jgi:hypothetical protein
MGKVENRGVSAGSTSCIVNNGGRDNKIANNLCVGWSESVATSDCGITWFATAVRAVQCPLDCPCHFPFLLTGLFF